MTLNRTFKHLLAWTRVALVAALLVGVVVRGLVPVGYMIGPQADSGLVGITICSATGAHTVLPGPGDDAPAKAPALHHQACVFASALAVVQPVDDQPGVARPDVAPSSPLPIDSDALPRVRFVAQHRARAPPVLS